MATTTTNQRSTVVGVFSNRDQADRAVAELRRVGFRDDQIGYVMHDTRTDTTRTASASGEDNTEEGAVAGAVTGGVLGGLAGAIAAGLIPGVGPIIAAGILAATAGGVAVGAVAGGLVGALIGMGIPEEEARYYEGEAKAGRVLVTVRADGRYDEAWGVIQRHGGYNRATASASTAELPGAARAVSQTESRTAHAGHAGASAVAGEQTLKLHEEQLHAHKHSVDAGEVRVRKEVVTEKKTIEVPVEREEVVIERRAATGQKATSGDIRPGEEIRMTVKEEQVNVTKTPVVTEEVTVGKRKVTETEQVSGTVRKEQVKVEQTGDVDVTDKNSGSRKKR